MNNLIVGQRYTWFHKRSSNLPKPGWSIREKEYFGNTSTSKYYEEPGFSINTHIIIEFLEYIDTADKKRKMCSVKVVNRKGEEIEDGEIYNGLVEECLKQV